MTQEARLLGHIKGILFLGAGYPHLFPELGGSRIQISA
jgi:hypothetical protein